LLVAKLSIVPVKKTWANLFKVFSADQVAELVDIAEGGDSKDQHCALAVMDHFVRSKYDPRCSLENRARR
jgi:hypothetical protein